MTSFATSVPEWPKTKLEANIVAATIGQLAICEGDGGQVVVGGGTSASGGGSVDTAASLSTSPTTASLSSSSSTSRKPRAVLLSTGSFNPVHSGHVAMLEAAKKTIEGRGYNVLGGFLSPSHDLYVKPKMSNLKPHDAPLRMYYAPAEQRLKIIELAMQSSSWISQASWECRQPRFVDYPSVLCNLEEWLRKENYFTSPEDIVVYVCGEDHYRNCCLENGVTYFNNVSRHVCVVPRGGMAPASASAESPFVFIVPVANESVDNLSSTKIRTQLHSGDWKGLSLSCPKAVFDYLRTGDGAILYRKRKVFISFSVLYREMVQPKGVPMSVLQDSLFFFGSKKMWFWPRTEEEKRELESPSYVAKMKAHPEIESLLLEKMKRNEVYFLKPDVLDVQTGDYAPVSLWLQSLGYKPLILDPLTWSSIEKAKPTSVNARLVVENFQVGDHDYTAVITLLQESCGDQLEAALNFSEW